MSTTPPTLPVDTLPDAEPPTTKWPTRLGVFSIVYAAGGLLCQIGAAASTMFTETLMRIIGLGEIEIPAATRYPTIAMAGATALVGILLLIGGINLLRRRRKAIAQLKGWAVLRMFLLLVGTLVWVATLPANMEFQRQIQDLGNERAIEGGRPDMAKEFDEEGQWRRSVIGMAVMGPLFSIYPLFLGFYLSRRSVKEEVSTWEG